VRKNPSTHASETTISVRQPTSIPPGSLARTSVQSRCPHCHELVEVGADGMMVEIACGNCGGSFRLLNADTLPHTPGATISIGRFELLEELGRGAFGRVWKARDHELDRLVAIKIPHRAALDDIEAERTQREARAAAQLRHPGIVSVHEVIRDEGLIYIVSDYIAGVTLQDWLQSRVFTTREAVHLLIRIAEAMDHAHRQGVIHRDLKPGNILIDAERNPHITDFGLAKREQAEVTVTVEGQVLGTPSYMSPQQAGGEGHSVDGRTDVYSLGVILFQLLTRELPFRGSSRMIILQILHDEPPSPRRLKAGIPRDLSTITLKCLEKDPQRRYETAGALALDLKRWLDGQPIQARPVSTFERAWRWCRRNPTVASLAASLAALLLLVAVGSTAYSFRLARYAEREHQARTEAETYFRMTLDAIDEMLTEVGEESIAHVPQMEAVQKTLLGKALALHQRLVQAQPSHPGLQLEFARAQHRMGDIYELLGEHEQAKGAYAAAIELCGRLRTTTSDNPQVRHQLAKSHTMLGEAFRKTVPGEADQHYADALELQEELHRRQPADDDILRELSRTLNNRGLLFSETGSYAPAETALQEAIQHLQELTARDPARDDYVADLGRAQINLGVVLKRLPGRGTAAESAYQDAIGNLERLVSRKPDNRDYRYKLSVAMKDLANLLLEIPAPPKSTETQVAERHGQAVEWARKASARLSELSRDFQGIPLYQYELASSLNSLANALVEIGDFSTARGELDHANNVLDELARSFPEYAANVAEYQSLRGFVYGSLAAFECQINKDPTAAQTCVERAIEHQRQATILAPDNPKYSEMLKRHQKYLENDILKAQASGTTPP